MAEDVETQTGEELEAEEDVSEDLIAKATAAAIRIEEANKETTKLLMKAEQMKVTATLSGKTEAGTPKKTQEQKEEEEARRFLEGTGIDPFGE